MKKIFFPLLTLLVILFSCGETNEPSSNLPPIEVDVEDWNDVLISHSDKANSYFEDVNDAIEKEVAVSELESKIEVALTDLNNMIAEANAHQIKGANAEKLENLADNSKVTLTAFYQAIIDYLNIVKENAAFLLKHDWDDADNKKFEAEILPIEDKVYNARDKFYSSSDEFFDKL